MIAENNKKRCVIITAGPMGDYAALKKEINPESDYIISADGGYDHLKGLGITANIEIGDFDSAKEVPKDIEVFRFKCEKDETDTMLAVMRGLEMSFRDFVIVGGLKGRLDHTYANLTTLFYIAHHGAIGKIIDSDNEAYFIENGKMEFAPRKDFYISVFAYGGDAVGVTEKNMKYKLDNYTLKSDYPIGVSNQFLSENAEISVKKGSLLVILSKKQ